MSPAPTPGSPPTEAELAALRAYWTTGDYQLAAEALGITRRALLQRLQRVRRRLQVDSTIVAIYRLRRRLVS